MARAKEDLPGGVLYEHDFHEWVEEQARLLREGDLGRLDLVNLIEEIEALGRAEKNGVKSNLVVVLMHLLKHQFQPKKRSRSWLSSILEHRQRLQDDLEASPSLRRYADEIFHKAYGNAHARATVETGLPRKTFPSEPPYTLEQALDLDFLPE